MTDNITLWELRGILGKIPFSEDELIELIEDGRLNALEIANTDHKLLTDKIQKELLYIDDNAEKVLIDVYNSTENNKINIKYIITKNPSAIEDFSRDKRMAMFNKLPDVVIKVCESGNPHKIKIFPEEHRMTIFNKFPNKFEKMFEKVPSIIKDFPKKHIMEIVNKLPNPFGKWIEKDPSAIDSFPEDQRMVIFNKFPDAFAKGFKKSPIGLLYFSNEQRMEIANKYPNIKL